MNRFTFLLWITWLVMVAAIFLFAFSPFTDFVLFLLAFDSFLVLWFIEVVEERCSS